MKAGQDGALDHHGELLPELSKSASKMNYRALLEAPLPKYEGNYPGDPLFTELGYFFLRRTMSSMFRTFEVTGTEKIPNDRGTLCAAWHTNGLVDPFSILLTHSKKFVVGGRHDLVTRPVLGFWARKFALQPVVRKAELLRGGCSDEDALRLNGRSLLNLATGISHGFGCALFPEGTSHSESHLIRLRTGPMRTVLAAAAHAKANDKNLPVIMPIGLHFRKRHLFRTDCWVEYTDPIEILADDLPADLVEAVKLGDWKEPPAESVIKLRDIVEERLTPLTPNRDTFSEVYRDGVIAHVKNRISGDSKMTWREEVLANRKLKSEPESEEVQVIATRIGDTLDQASLDGRDINSKGDGLRFASPFGTIVNLLKLVPMLAFLPTILLGLFPQMAMGRVLGDNTDEGLDARTSYQFLAGMFGSMGLWPILATVGIILGAIFSEEIDASFGIIWTDALGTGIVSIVAMYIIAWLGLILLFWISAKSFVIGWDSISDFSRFMRRRKTKSKVADDLLELHKLLL